MNEQGSIEWRRERLGRVTASKFDAVIRGPSSGAYISYARQIRAELDTLRRLNAGEEIAPAPDFYSAATAWGRRWEPVARAEYEWRNDCEVAVPPFMVHQSYPFAGASPDGLRQDGAMRVGLEIKVPYLQEVHARTLLHGMEDEHVPQVQGEMWVCGLDAVDFVSFDPRREDQGRYLERRVWRLDSYTAALELSVLEFWDFVRSEAAAQPEIPMDGVPILF